MDRIQSDPLLRGTLSLNTSDTACGSEESQGAKIGIGPPVSARVAGRAIVWMGGGMLALLCALVIAVGSAWLMGAAAGAYGENGGLFAFAGFLLALMALVACGLGGLAIEHGRNRRSSRTRYRLRPY